MDRSGVPCPPWLARAIAQEGGCISFCRFMDLALHHPVHGAYGSGALRIGPHGDFATSPSLGSDFAELLGLQVLDWLEQLRGHHPSNRLSLLEMGPGEGHLAHALLSFLLEHCPECRDQLEFVLVESNPGMQQRQRECLAAVTDAIPVRWSRLEDLMASPVVGVVIAHELLDAFAVERLVFEQGTLKKLGVVLLPERSSPQTMNLEPEIAWVSLPLDQQLVDDLAWATSRCGLQIPPDGTSEGWCSEWHPGVRPWLHQVAKALESGVLLVVDYALEAKRYYSPSRRDGTLLAYRQQQCHQELLRDAGQSDLTAHLCLEPLIAMAEEEGWFSHGACRQGEALLSLGLAQRLQALQHMPSSQLALALQRREALLRLVDPAGLGEFRWIAFERSSQGPDRGATFNSRFLREPLPQ